MEIYRDCRYECGDEDCNKCFIKGFIYFCEGCKFYEPLTKRNFRSFDDDMMDEEKRNN